MNREVAAARDLSWPRATGWKTGELAAEPWREALQRGRRGSPRPCERTAALAIAARRHRSHGRCRTTTRRSHHMGRQAQRVTGHSRSSAVAPPVSRSEATVRPLQLSYRQVWVRGYVDRVVIGCAAEVIARHPRSYEGEDMVFDPIHYLPLIERKIGALDQAAPLAGWELPDAFATLRRLMEARSGRAGRREYVQVLRLFETFGTDDVHAAVRHALRLGAIGFDAVKHLVLCRVEKRPPKLDLDVYPYLPKANVGKTCAASYLCLMSGCVR